MEYNRDLEIAAQNIAAIREREEICSEQTEILLRQLAARICSGDSKSDIFGIYERYCMISGVTEVEHKAVICRYLCESAEFVPYVQEILPFGDIEQLTVAARGTVAYVSNIYTDSVFAQLSASKRIKASSVSTMLEACESVWESSCEFCIIPIENGTDGKLYSFYSMLDRFDLKICDVIVQSHDDGINKTYFALAGKRINAEALKSQSARLEFSMVSEDEDVISKTVSAVKAFGAKTSCVGTQPTPYGDAGSRYYFTVDFDKSSPLPLIAYFALEHTRYSLVGLYSRK